ncbi:MAG TPA: GAF domain-containing protein, partial [Vicinamibacteria bacterium]
MRRLVVFGSGALRKVASAEGSGVTYMGADKATGRLHGALVELDARAARNLTAARQLVKAAPVGALDLRPSPTRRARASNLGFDFYLGVNRAGDPPCSQVLAELKGAPRGRRADSAADLRAELKKTARRLSILTDIVKTANSILEPRKVIELIMGRIQELIPSEAWSMLMVDEEKQELAFELALGAKGKEVSSFRVKMGEGIAGWVAETGRSAIVNDTARDPRFARKFDSSTQFKTRSILCAPLISRGRTIGVVEIINKLKGRFTQGDLEILLTLVEPCAIAI